MWRAVVLPGGHRQQAGALGEVVTAAAARVVRHGSPSRRGEARAVFRRFIDQRLTARLLGCHNQGDGVRKLLDSAVDHPVGQPTRHAG